jgi:hypothetical protein
MHYTSVLDQLHQRLLPRHYLEIGVQHGRTLALALPCTAAVGIDPAPSIEAAIGDATVVAATSDEFFARPDCASLLEPLDLAFIDGMHWYEFALRDFMNIESHSHRDTVVAVHDCLPTNPAMAGRVQQPGPGAWTGDVWKLVAVLRQARPDLTVDIVDAEPSGLALITGLDRANTVLRDGYDDILAAFDPLGFDALEPDPHISLNAVAEVDFATLPGPRQTADREALLRARASRRPTVHARVRSTRRRARATPAGTILRRARRRLGAR